MKRGLVIGKFMPVHKGHLALISFAVDQCDELIISMSYTSQDTIDYKIRLSWLRELMKGNAKIRVESIVDDFDNENLPWPERTAVWAKVLKALYPPVHVIISSEPYGDHLAIHLNAAHMRFDPGRTKIPISSSLIRTDPIRHWEFIPKAVQPYFVVKVCFNGPESTGKSVMAKHLAEKYNTEFVPEVARELITSNDFTLDDIIRIGHAQTKRVKDKLGIANRFLFCDTDLITTQIYAQHYLNEVPPVLFALEKEIKYDHYFLFDVDVPWVSDGLRDLGSMREQMMKIFHDAIAKRNIKSIMVRGSWQEREEIITNYINSMHGC